jgi:hypothetical protein
VLPTALVAAGLWGIAKLLHKRFDATLVERAQTLLVVSTVAFATLTVIGVWFRGPGMALTW